MIHFQTEEETNFYINFLFVTSIQTPDRLLRYKREKVTKLPLKIWLFNFLLQRDKHYIMFKVLSTT